jgi:hypothetical protein
VTLLPQKKLLLLPPKKSPLSGTTVRIVILAILLCAKNHMCAQDRTIASVIPALAYGPACSSTIQLRNLSDRTVTLDLEGHRESGSLVGLVGLSDTRLHLAPRQQTAYKLDIQEETTGAWAKVREDVPAPDLQPAIAVAAAQECTIGAQLRTIGRAVAYPTRNPWFAGEVDELGGSVISLINTSEAAVRATACYSSGNLFSVNGSPLQPVCSATVDVQVPPFNSRQFPVSKDGSTHLSLRTRGDAIVLEMLRPLGENLRVYAVDSSIKFGEEAKP